MRAITTKTLLSKVYKLFEFKGIWKKIFGTPEKGGFWIIYGNEKNGKTLFALLLANFLSKYESVLYISAEEGTGAEFQKNVERAKISYSNRKIKYLNYTELDEVETIMRKRQSANIVIFDNITIYVDELKNGRLRKLFNDYPNKTMIFLAHEEKNEPHTATGKLCKKLAKIIIRIDGMVAYVSGRCPGGEIIINEKTAMLVHGSEILKTNQ